MSVPSGAERAMGWPRLVRDAKGLPVRTRREIITGAMVLPAGAVGTLEQSTAWHRLRFRTAPCECCGVSMRLQTHRGDLEPIR